MARSRNIKPGFFTNEILGELDPLARILFAGMWCHADRDGRLEDRMKRLKPQVLPYDNCDIDALAQCLHDAGLVLRYVIDGKGYIQVLKFKEHQNPHVKEAPSTIPAPGEHQTNTGVAGLIPDSLNPLTDSLKTSRAVAPAAIPTNTTPADIAAALRSEGVKAMDSNPHVIDMAQRGVSVVHLRAAIGKIRDRGKTNISLGYLVPVAIELAQQQNAPPTMSKTMGAVNKLQRMIDDLERS